jgi:glycerol-3-phosphate acyltransferase PlsY
MVTSLTLVLGGYLFGSLASAVVVCRILRLPDPRDGGSGNPGATNVLRLGGRKAAAITLAGDVLKGVAPVLIGRWLDADPAVLAATALAAFLGHLFPVFFGFRGGKGVATAFGAVAALAWPVALAMGVSWLAVAVATRYASLASLTAAVVAPLAATVLAPNRANLAVLAVMTGLLMWRHRANIGRLRDGTESRIGQGAGGAA